MFESVGKKVSVGHSFICDYGCNISIGNNVSINTGCTFVDCNKIIIGNNVLIAPNVQIYTATHPVELNERLTPTETEDGTAYIRHTYALPVTIEDGCWIGGGGHYPAGCYYRSGKRYWSGKCCHQIHSGKQPCRRKSM